MQLSLRELDEDTTQISVVGEFSFSDNSKFREMLKQLEIKRPSLIYVDFAQANFIDSAALGMLLLLKEKADELSATVEIHGAAGQVLKVLELSRFQDLFVMSNHNSGGTSTAA